MNLVFRQVKQTFPFSKSFLSDLVTPSDSTSALVSTERMCCTSFSVSDKHSSDFPSSVFSQIVATWFRASSLKSKFSIISAPPWCFCNDLESNPLIECRLSLENNLLETKNTKHKLVQLFITISHDITLSQSKNFIIFDAILILVFVNLITVIIRI